MKRIYTVILMYPLGMTDGNLETYTTKITAKSPENAVILAQVRAVKAQCVAYHRSDFIPIAVFSGVVVYELGVNDFPEVKLV